MATWNDLPFEIRDRIVYFFCLDIITEYDSAPTDIFNPEYYKLDEGKQISSVKLAPPECLSHFGAAVRTSRYFYLSMTNRIMFDDRSAALALKRMQADKFDELYDNTIDYDFQHKHLDALAAVIGFYWNNPYCLEKSHIFTFFLLHFVRSDCVPSYLPVLRRWLSNQATSAAFPNKTPYIWGSILGLDSLRLYFNVGSLSTYDGYVDVFSIEGIAAADHEFNEVDLLWMEGDEQKLDKHGKQAVCQKINCSGIDLRRAIEDAAPNTWRCMIDTACGCKWFVMNFEMNTVVQPIL
jgi:hypothetical protein